MGRAIRNLSYGLYVIGTKAKGRNVGCVVNTVFQITSKTPSMIAISMNKDNYTYQGIEETKKFSVSILSEKAEGGLIGVFGFQSSKDADKFADVEYRMEQDIPVVTEDANGYLLCEVVSCTDADTHNVILAKVVEDVVLNEEPSMTYAYYHDVIKGKAPKNAPTYVEEEKIEEKEETYVCDICGYIYKGDITKEDDSFRCPICKADKSHFKKM